MKILYVESKSEARIKQRKILLIRGKEKEKKS